uniref:basic proline-rich protein-like n=1 Tax=Jaculus jaculus TaxID=51337 RepID=UPI001E1B5B16|nr:basic proline-rich protein-like [Jaculus jaculus]
MAKGNSPAVGADSTAPSDSRGPGRSSPAPFHCQAPRLPRRGARPPILSAGAPSPGGCGCVKQAHAGPRPRELPGTRGHAGDGAWVRAARPPTPPHPEAGSSPARAADPGPAPPRPFLCPPPRVRTRGPPLPAALPAGLPSPRLPALTVIVSHPLPRGPRLAEPTKEVRRPRARRSARPADSASHGPPGSAQPPSVGLSPPPTRFVRQPGSPACGSDGPTGRPPRTPASRTADDLRCAPRAPSHHRRRRRRRSPGPAAAAAAAAAAGPIPPLLREHDT